MKVLIFGGTSEGRKLSEILSKAGIEVSLSVATELGRNMAADEQTAGRVFLTSTSSTILSGRLDEEDMIQLMKQGEFDCVVDATHPYAVIAAQNIRSACKATGLMDFRLKRPEGEAVPAAYVPDASVAAEILNKNDEKVLLTIGSKELEPFTHVDKFRERLFVRILPAKDSLKKALDLGFRESNIICMQGPFDREMNTATLKMTGAKYLVTKDSGNIGGFGAKVSAAISLGCKVIVISRPIQEEGYTFNELLKAFNVAEDNVAGDGDPDTPLLLEKSGYREQPSHQQTVFPLFIDIYRKKILIIGGGNIAERRIKVLSSFKTDIVVISPAITEYIKSVASEETISLLDRKYQNGDIAAIKPFLVIAATNDRQVNQTVMKEAVSLNTPISVADCRGECTFYFPAIAENETYIAGIVSKIGNHDGVRQIAEKIRRLLHT